MQFIEGGNEKYYFSQASPGLQCFLDIRIHNKVNFINNIVDNIDYYPALKKENFKIQEYKFKIENYMKTLKSSYPKFVEPEIYFLVGRLNTGGTALDGKVMIGVEMFFDGKVDLFKNKSALDSLMPKSVIPHMVFHEVIHTQKYFDDIPNDSVDYGTLLTNSIVKGSAEF